jgi:carboxylesterase type B
MRFTFSVVVISVVVHTSAKIVSTLHGQVDGNTVTTDDGTVVNSWYGIPYASPPIGDLRFEVGVVRSCSSAQ